MRWRTAEGAVTRPSANEVSRGHLLELAMAVEVRECIGALKKEHRHVQVSMNSIGGAY